MLKRIPLPVAVLVVLTLLVLRPADSAAERFSFIRDAEIENTIRVYAAPLFRAAGLESSEVRIFLVNDRRLNAFVAGGQKLFLNTGLLIQSDHAGQVIGVIAHETGHIAGDHLVRRHDAIKNSSAQSILGLVLGGAAVVAGRPDVGAAVFAGSQSASLRSFLQYNRTQESAADGAAMNLLEETGQSARGMLEFMEKLSDQELLSVGRQDPYLRTHPLSRDRIETLRDFVSRSAHSDVPVSLEFAERHRRMRAKLIAFIENPSFTLRQYRSDDDSLEARYARAIAHYRKPDLDTALPQIDALIAERPNDPYFHELKGQMLFENGRIEEALSSYEKAVHLLPNSALIRTDLARVQMATQDPTLNELAILNLTAALRLDRTRAFAWRQLAIAHGRTGHEGESALALAEEAVLQGKKRDARFHAGKAEKLLPKGSKGWLHARDILVQTEGQDDKR